MPNHVINEITLHGVTLEQARHLIFNKKGEISFQVLLPLPMNFWSGSVGKVHHEAFHGNWLDAARETWGTKWDAYGSPTAVEQDGSTVIIFKTAWSHPRGWLCAIFNTLDCNITASWLDEGREDGCREIWSFKNDVFGPEWKQETIASSTPEHGRLHKLLWGVEEFEVEEDDDAMINKAMET